MSLFEQLRRFLGDAAIPPVEEPEHPHLARAVLLLEAATYDDDFAEPERNRIHQLLTDKYEVGPEEVEELLLLARRKRAMNPDIHAVTREINARMSRKDKFELMTEVWQVIFADGKVDPQEEHFARKLQSLLRLDHPTWIKAKLRAQTRQRGKRP